MKTYDQLWIGCQNEPSAILRWIECHPGLASWGQAAFTALTIVAAIYAPRIAEIFSERRKWRKRVTATLNALHTLQAATREVGKHVGKIRTEFDRILWKARPTPLGDDWPVWCENVILLPVPIVFEQQADRWPGADPGALVPFDTLRQAIIAYNHACAEMKQRSVVTDREYWTARRTIDNWLHDLEACRAAALDHGYVP